MTLMFPCVMYKYEYFYLKYLIFDNLSFTVKNRYNVKAYNKNRFLTYDSIRLKDELSLFVT